METKIGVKDKALRNLAILFIFPILTTLWLAFLWGLWAFQQSIFLVYANQSPETWYLLYIFFLGFVIILQFIAIFYIRLYYSQPARKPDDGLN